MPNTFTLIASSTVGSGGASSIDFTSIPSTYTDLQILISGRTSDANAIDNFKIYFNGSNANRSSTHLVGIPTNPTPVRSSNLSTSQTGVVNANTSTSSTFGSASYYIPNYAGSNNKVFSDDTVSEGNVATMQMMIDADLWSSTAAITSITIMSMAGGNWNQYSSAYLYGIKNS